MELQNILTLHDVCSISRINGVMEGKPINLCGDDADKRTIPPQPTTVTYKKIRQPVDHDVMCSGTLCMYKCM